MGVFTTANALEISTTFGKEGGEDFSVLSLRNDSAFSCQEITDVYSKVLSIECEIARIPDRGFPGLENSFFRINYKMIDGHFWLYIYPKHKQKLFAIPKDPKADFTMDKNPQQNAKIWQIVGYKNKIPFLSQDMQDQRQGLDFPVKILGEQTPFIPELNSDNRPLKATNNKDFEIYSLVKQAMERQDYISAITEINEALKQNPNSVFRRDLTYDRIIATSKLELDDNEVLINPALEWVRAFASDPDVPEILYILAKAYVKNNVPNEAEYYYKRISDEYPESKIAPLAQMQLANLAKTNSPTRASIYFQKAYTEAKDIPSASEIAAQWALFEAEQRDMQSAQDLLQKVLDNYPRFFVDSLAQTQEIIEALIENEDYATPAKIAQVVIKNAPDIATKEEYSFRLGEYYANALDFDKAHEYNQSYIKEFEEDYKDRAKLVQDRDDEILFAIGGDDVDKLKRYAYIITKYPDTDESAKAKELSAQILLSARKYQDVMSIYENDPDNAYRKKAIESMIKDAAAKKECASIVPYLTQNVPYELSAQEKLFVFDCASGAGLNASAKYIAQGMVESSKTQDARLEWLYRVANNLYNLGEYKDASLAARDALTLAINQKKHYDIAFTLFDILSALDSRNEAKKALPFLKEHFANDARILPVYATLLGYSIDEKDSMSIELYARDIIKLQSALKTDEFTPYAEFALANVLRENKNLAQALSTLKPLESKQLDKEDSQQLFYRIASIYNAQAKPKEALEYFDKCAQIDTQSEWRTLCVQAKELIAGNAGAGAGADSSAKADSEVESSQN
ncbi:MULTISPECIES: tetratricopeptide repeat protein [unclassified Helicobacter]|uniref:tetratricopeptide repeat protein n=1 Tax=unclassified Helicobacter TaxID=2593540 RepID=UPI00115FF435|nr:MULTISPECIES: tetratricopeptide repeat protein [unclassified Helicobacter]